MTVEAEVTIESTPEVPQEDRSACDDNLQHAKQHQLAQHRSSFVDAKLHSNDEEKEHDADLSHSAERARAINELQSAGPDDDARQEKPKDRAEFEPIRKNETRENDY